MIEKLGAKSGFQISLCFAISWRVQLHGKEIKKRQEHNIPKMQKTAKGPNIVALPSSCFQQRKVKYVNGILENKFGLKRLVLYILFHQIRCF